MLEEEGWGEINIKKNPEAIDDGDDDELCTLTVPLKKV